MGASFNPRARDGRDGRLADNAGSGRGFNPRARDGRDRHRSLIRTCCSRFNPRARDGRDCVSGINKWIKKWFQSTRP